jgi:hypothetical protein
MKTSVPFWASIDWAKEKKKKAMTNCSNCHLLVVQTGMRFMPWGGYDGEKVMGGTLVSLRHGFVLIASAWYGVGK